ncbi:PD-(D/E)XK nuclease family transposase [Paenibacillus koleovorans]|uniref:PD-(D/E)XK nuclease family transposase n=1 Tax=Paenibacillus koleovorans TaxID=121608 RepID=UPI001580D7A7|nr:PD-(D/E)XK nuclease family transposase [Paenibacillus koleovorans]
MEFHGVASSSRRADTTSRTSGKDIIAIDRQGKELWISVKGYLEKSSNVQARHWFSSNCLNGVDKSNWEVLAMNESVLKKAMDTLEFLSQDAEARRMYEDRQKYLHDEASMIEGALAEGERKRAIAMTVDLLALGIEPSIIATASGLSVSEIESLKKPN